MSEHSSIPVEHERRQQTLLTIVCDNGSPIPE